ncbi:extracellular solute-binding protein [Pseudonocardia sp. CA-107938]|uniref:extracellular solute-binding protein n=1 Tax=Pseudonocardia sp. CA-107938 TaxID=3240021 RepID=UPI003D9363D6
MIRQGRRTTRPLRVAAAAATAALALVAACSRPSATTAASAGAAIDDGPATGTVTLWAPSGDANGLDAMLAGFKKANPDATVQVTIIPSDDYQTKLQTAIAAGTTPDIAQLYTESQSQVLASKALAPVPAGLVDKSSFFPAAYAAGEVGGVAYSVPWYAYSYVLLYRKDFAAKAGVTPPRTWDELVPFLKGLQAGGAVKGIGYDVGWDRYSGQDLALLAYQNGSTLLNADRTKWELDTPQVVGAATFLQSLFTSGVASPDTPGFLDQQPYLVSGKVGSLITGPWVVSQLDAVAKQPGWTAANIGAAVLPAGPAGNYGFVGGGSWGVFAKSKQAASAWKVVKYLSQPSTQVAQFTAYGSLPAVTAAWKDPAVAGQPLLAPYFTQLEGAKQMPDVSTWTEVATAIGKEMEFVARGKETPEAAMKNVQSRADTISTGAK